MFGVASWLVEPSHVQDTRSEEDVGSPGKVQLKSWDFTCEHVFFFKKP